MANYHEGQDATGSLTFELTKNTPPLQVFVSIIGQEHVMWKRRVRSGKSTRIVTYRDSAECCSQRFMVMQSAESFLPGQYTYPFTFKVPAGSPGTYVHASGQYSNRAEASVTYSVYCELLTPDEMIGRAQCPIVLMQEARTPYNYNLESDINKSITTWCCCNKGNVNLKCTFEKDVVRMDESVMMRFTADLCECNITVNTIKCELQRKLYLKTRSGMTTFRKHSLISMPVNGVEAGKKIEGERIVQFDLNQCLDLGTPANLTGALGDFAGKIQQTCNGQLVQSTYELHVIADCDGCLCCDAPPFVFTPIEVLAPQRVIAFFMAMPAMPTEADPGAMGMPVQYDPNQPAVGGPPAPYPQPGIQPQGAPEGQPMKYNPDAPPAKSGTKAMAVKGDDTPQDAEEDV